MLMHATISYLVSLSCYRPQLGVIAWKMGLKKNLCYSEKQELALNFVFEIFVNMN
jgi:hypothetical protein